MSTTKESGRPARPRSNPAASGRRPQIGAGVLESAGGERHRVAEAQEADVRHDMLVSAMSSLNDRERHILTERRLTDDPKTLEELSQVYGVSRERVRQIEVRAFEKLQKAMLRVAGEKRLLAI